MKPTYESKRAPPSATDYEANLEAWRRQFRDMMVVIDAEGHHELSEQEIAAEAGRRLRKQGIVPPRGIM